MRFREVPEAAKVARPWAKVITYGPPRGQEWEIDFLEAQSDPKGTFGITQRVFLDLEEGDLEKMAAGNPIELSLVLDGMVPLAIEVWQHNPTADEIEEWRLADEARKLTENYHHWCAPACPRQDTHHIEDCVCGGAQREWDDLMAQIASQGIELRREPPGQDAEVIDMGNLRQNRRVEDEKPST